MNHHLNDPHERIPKHGRRNLRFLAAIAQRLRTYFTVVKQAPGLDQIVRRAGLALDQPSKDDK